MTSIMLSSDTDIANDWGALVAGDTVTITPNGAIATPLAAVELDPTQSNISVVIGGYMNVDSAVWGYGNIVTLQDHAVFVANGYDAGMKMGSGYFANQGSISARYTGLFSLGNMTIINHGSISGISGVGLGDVGNDLVYNAGKITGYRDAGLASTGGESLITNTGIINPSAAMEAASASTAMRSSRTWARSGAPWSPSSSTARPRCRSRTTAP